MMAQLFFFFFVIILLLIFLYILCNMLHFAFMQCMRKKADIVDINNTNEPNNDYKYIDESIPLDKKLECSICLMDETDLKLPCNHCFHEKCLAEWFEESPTCPMCRKDYVEHFSEV